VPDDVELVERPRQERRERGHREGPAVVGGAGHVEQVALVEPQAADLDLEAARGLLHEIANDRQRAGADARPDRPGVDETARHGPCARQHAAGHPSGRPAAFKARGCRKRRHPGRLPEPALGQERGSGSDRQVAGVLEGLGERQRAGRDV
jgi:hypothetical protein